MSDDPRKRVKCANCGMVYDILQNPCDYGLSGADGNCPGCKSNAYEHVQANWQISHQWDEPQ